MRPARAAAPPVQARVFQVRHHDLRVTCHGGRWAVAVDGVALEHWYTTQVAAWEAGVREADGRDRDGANA